MESTGLHLEIDWEPPTLIVQDMKPGDSETATFTLRNENPVPIELRSTTLRQGELFSGTDPLVVDFELATDEGCPENPNALAPGATATATLTATFPGAAGNEYQGLSGSAILSVTATQTSVCGATAIAPDQDLAMTGLELTLPILVGIMLVTTGGFIRWHRHHARGRRDA